MSRGCELRRISQEDASLFLRYPEKLLELEIARYEASKGKGYVEEVVDPTRQFYDWRVLTALVSDSAAWVLLVEGGQQVGKTEQMWAVLDADARILSIEQVQALDESLKELLAEEDEQALIDLAMAEQTTHLVLIQSEPEEWTIDDLEPEEDWAKWPKPWRRPEAEINLELYWIKQQVQQFVQTVVEVEELLMIIA